MTFYLVLMQDFSEKAYKVGIYIYFPEYLHWITLI